jgi:hypothetical protein
VRLALVAMLVVVCEREKANQTVRREPPVATTTAAAVRVACPATGLWSRCTISERLDRAGLAPRIDSSAVTEPPLTIRGLLLHVGASDLEIYLYPDAKAREREESLLDRTKYVAYDAPLAMKPQPTLIHSVNAIAILHSRNDHLRERVSDAITAGPPQPPK